MPSREPAAPDRDVLPAAAAARLLDRASRLDAAREDAVSVTHLRAAAADAGIAPAAFDAALAELCAGESPPAPARARPAGRRGWRSVTGAAAAVLLAAGALATAGQRIPGDTPPAAGTVEEAILLRCVTPGEAAALVRPLLREDRASVARWHPTAAPRVLTVRATPAAMRRVKALLAEHEGAPARACTTPPSPAPAP